MKIETPKIIVNENYGKPFQLNEPSMKIITDYQAWCLEIEPLIPTAKSAWDFQSNQIKYLESLVKTAALTMKGQAKLLQDLKDMYEQLVADNYKLEMSKNNE